MIQQDVHLLRVLLFNPSGAKTWMSQVTSSHVIDYCQISNINHTKYQNLNVSHLILQLTKWAIYWSQVLSREWRCSWSSADRRCCNYIWGSTVLSPAKVHLVLEIWWYVGKNIPCLLWGRIPANCTISINADKLHKMFPAINLACASVQNRLSL